MRFYHKCKYIFRNILFILGQVRSAQNTNTITIPEAEFTKVNRKQLLATVLEKTKISNNIHRLENLFKLHLYVFIYVFVDRPHTHRRWKPTLTLFTLASARWGLRLLRFLGDLLPRLAGDSALLPGERSLVTAGDLLDWNITVRHSEKLKNKTPGGRGLSVTTGNKHQVLVEGGLFYTNYALTTILARQNIQNMSLN